MKNYAVKITDRALAHIENIYDHIANVLLSYENAAAQYNRITKAILKLDVLPERFELVNFEPERSMGIRRMTVDNYSVFFVAIGNTVTVIDVLYSASDIESRMRE